MIIYEYPGTTYTYFDNDLYNIKDSVPVQSSRTGCMGGGGGATSRVRSITSRVIYTRSSCIIRTVSSIFLFLK
jgi:hypothetical protein